MNSFEKNKHITSKLQKMPQMKDKRTKQEVWQKIALHNESKKKRISKKSLHLFPIFSTVLVVAILVIIVPQFINDGLVDTSNEGSLNNGTESQETNNDIQINNDGNEDATSETQTIQDDFEQKVVTAIDEDEQIVYAVVPDSQVQYMIPTSFIIPKSDDFDAYYNDLDNYLTTESWGTGEYALQNGIDMDIDQANKQVTMHIAPNFDVGSSSAETTVFRQTLTYMFQPLGVEEVHFETEDNLGVDLGSFGVMQELTIDSIPAVSYKLYQEAPDKRSFIVPVPSMEGEKMTIQEAMGMMKEDQADFHIQKTIPKDVHFDIEGQDEQLNISFTNGTSLTNSQKTITMVESMLMTAKSFGYTSVLFEQAGMERIGPYDLTNPIDVPLAVNPINLNREE